MILKKKKLNAFINILIGSILMLNAIFNDFSDVQALFYFQMILGGLSLYLGIFDLTQPIVKITENKLFFFRPFGIPAKEIAFDEIADVEMKNDKFFIFNFTDKAKHKVILNLSNKDHQLWMEFLNKQNWIS